MIYPERKCAHEDCNIMFVPTRKDNIYHNDKCKMDAFKKKKALGNTSTDQPKNNVSLTKNDIAAPFALEPSAQFIIDTLKQYNRDLADTCKEQAGKIETLTKEKNDLEKERDKALNDLNAKPSGLAGFAQNPENIKEVVKEIPTILKGITDAIIAARTPAQKQIAGTDQGSGEHELVQWLASQPEEIQVAFITMVQSLNAITDAKQRLEYITYINRSTMNVRGSAAV